MDNERIHIEYSTAYYRPWSIYSRIYLVITLKGKLKCFAPSRDDSIDAKPICLCRQVTQAVDGFAMVKPVISKLRSSKLYSY
jgi:hypothetical protein